MSGNYPNVSESPEKSSRKCTLKKVVPLTKEGQPKKCTLHEKDEVQSENSKVLEKKQSTDTAVTTDNIVPADYQTKTQKTSNSAESQKPALKPSPSKPVSEIPVNTSHQDSDKEYSKTPSTVSSVTGSSSLSSRTNPFWQYMEASSKLQLSDLDATIKERELRVKVVDIIGQAEEKSSLVPTKETMANPKLASTFGGLKRKLKSTNFGAFKKRMLEPTSEEQNFDEQISGSSKEKVKEQIVSISKLEKSTNDLTDSKKNTNPDELSRPFKDTAVCQNYAQVGEVRGILEDSINSQNNPTTVEVERSSNDTKDLQKSCSQVELNESSQALLAQCKPCFIKLVNFFPKLIQSPVAVPKLKLKKDIQRNWTCSMKDSLPSLFPKSADKDKQSSSMFPNQQTKVRKNKRKKKNTLSASETVRKSLTAYERHYISYVSGHKKSVSNSASNSVAASNASESPVAGKSTSNHDSGLPTSSEYTRPFSGPFRTYYMCKKCPLTLYDKEAMCEHICLHLNIKPYACNACSVKFDCRVALASHQNAEHPGIGQQSKCVMSGKEEDHFISVLSEKHEEKQIEELKEVQRNTHGLQIQHYYNLDKQNDTVEKTARDSESSETQPNVHSYPPTVSQEHTSEDDKKASDDQQQSFQVPSIESIPLQENTSENHKISETHNLSERLTERKETTVRSTFPTQPKRTKQNRRRAGRRSWAVRYRKRRRNRFKKTGSNLTSTQSSIPVSSAPLSEVDGSVAKQSPSIQEEAVQISISEIVKRKSACMAKPVAATTSTGSKTVVQEDMASVVSASLSNIEDIQKNQAQPVKTVSPKRVRQVSPEKKISSSEAISTAVSQLRELQSTYAIPATTELAPSEALNQQPKFHSIYNNATTSKSSVSLQSQGSPQKEKKKVMYATIGTQTDSMIDDEDDDDDVIFIGMDPLPKQPVATQTKTSAESSQMATKSTHQPGSLMQNNTAVSSQAATRALPNIPQSVVTTGRETSKSKQMPETTAALTLHEPPANHNMSPNHSLQSSLVPQQLRRAPLSGAERQILEDALSTHTPVSMVTIPMSHSTGSSVDIGSTYTVAVTQATSIMTTVQTSVHVLPQLGRTPLSDSHPTITEVLKKTDRQLQQGSNSVAQTSNPPRGGYPSQVAINRAYLAQAREQSKAGFVPQKDGVQPSAVQNEILQAFRQPQQNIRQPLANQATVQQAVQQPPEMTGVRQQAFSGIRQLSPQTVSQLQQGKTTAYNAVRAATDKQSTTAQGSLGSPGSQSSSMVIPPLAMPAQAMPMIPQQFPMMMPMMSMMAAGQGQQMMPTGQMSPFMVPYYHNSQGMGVGQSQQPSTIPGQQRASDASPTRVVSQVPSRTQQAPVHRQSMPQAQQYMPLSQQQQVQQPQPITSQQPITTVSGAQICNPTQMQKQSAIVTQPLVRQLRPPPPLIHVPRSHFPPTTTSTAHIQHEKQSGRKGDQPQDLRVRQRENSGDGSPKVTSTTGDQDALSAKNKTNNIPDFSVFNIKAPRCPESDKTKTDLPTSIPVNQQVPSQPFNPMLMPHGGAMMMGPSYRYQQCFLAPTKDASGNPGLPVTLVQCGFCFHWFDSMKNLEHHMYEKRSTHKGFACPICNYGPLMEMYAVKQHYERSHPNEQVVYFPAARSPQLTASVQNVQA
ncbi:uncharacterized protein LOC106173802 isoform X2 [Lingula anatina]|uniref:Uncharacterized protein LOC106173802 isoform X2 n=1 Tax=Lingula anatina TaxID=7574 RepID=A0A1S3JKS4_LINAN|nr:uncharacterized protein LOC106173802 isoform X2 [Lingula anatina]|eukprot:XP_013410504.1 uncharacterized protein LOC106173802 isoform X2 [Lingula anatina]